MEYTETQKVIVGLLTECTGRVGTYGATPAWVKNINKDLIFGIEELDIGEDLLIPVHLFMDFNLEVTEVTKNLEKQLKKAYGKLGYGMTTDPEDDFGPKGDWVYTYNYNYNILCDLSQNIQYIKFEYKGGVYVMLQVHNGVDARYGITDARIFEVKDWDNFILGMQVSGYATHDSCGESYDLETSSHIRSDCEWNLEEEKWIHSETGFEVSIIVYFDN
jgi:hypothetical protein